MAGSAWLLVASGVAAESSAVAAAVDDPSDSVGVSGLEEVAVGLVLQPNF